MPPLLLSLLSSPGWSADFDKGVTAYGNGDFATALKEWTPLAEQGHADAQLNLVLMYYYGKGVLQNNIYAHMWLNIAALSGDENAAERRDSVASRMTSAAIHAAQKRAREYVAATTKGVDTVSFPVLPGYTALQSRGDNFICGSGQ